MPSLPVMTPTKAGSTGGALRIAGLIGWIAAGIPVFFGRGPDLLAPVGLDWVAFGVFGLAFFVVSSVPSRKSQTALKSVWLLFLMVLAVLSLAWLRRTGFEGILLVIVAAVAVLNLSPAVAAAWCVAQTACFAALFATSPFRARAIGLVLAYGASQTFVFAIAIIARREKAARLELARTNAELQAARELLAESSRLSERTRISRDLHDVLGHHLTALSLNLEVAMHVAEGRALLHVEKARAVTKLLLADVRAVVSRFREETTVDLGPSLRRLADLMPSPRIHLEAPGEVPVGDASAAEALLFAVQEIITNASRHSKAENLWIRVSKEHGRLVLHARDDGRGAEGLTEGHGLSGMRERIRAKGGEIAIETAPGEGLAVSIAIADGHEP